MAAPLPPLRRVVASTAAEVCGRAGLSAAAGALLEPALPPGPYLAALAEAGLAADALRFLAFALPAREGVWWAARVGAAMGGGEAAADPCYAAAEDWVYRPGEERRLACLDAAERAGARTPGAFAALGAAWSSGSMARPPAPAAAPYLSPTAVAASVLLAVAAADPALHAVHLGDALRCGLDVGDGGDGRAPAGAAP